MNHQAAGCALDALADPTEDHAHGRRHEQRGRRKLKLPVLQKRAEAGRDLLVGGELRQAPVQAIDEITQTPSGDDRVVAQNHESREDAQAADQAPRGADRRLEGADGALLRLPADEDLGHHDRQADQGDAHEVDEHERTAPVVPRDVRELPQVAETDGASRGGKHEADARTPVVASLLHGAPFSSWRRRRV
jgi:hypothetical protein